MERTDSPAVLRLGRDGFEPVVDVLTEAFAGYPVMTFVLGEDEVGERLRTLVRLFVANRVYRDDPIFGVVSGGRLIAAMTMTEPVERQPSPELEPLRRDAWESLGAEARARYQQCVEVWQGFQHPTPHHHVNMIGVLPAERGRGLARRLLDEAHALAAAHPSSAGVSLTTETAANVPFYERLGYVAPAPVEIAGDFRTWDFFRATTRPA